MSTAEAVLQMEDTGVVRKALRRLKGRATVGDVASATGLAQARAEAALRSLLEMHQGHLEVGERGDLVYAFEPSLIRRDAVPVWTRLRESAWAIFKTGFKIWIAAMLVIYFVIFVALMIAAVLAGNRDGEGGGLGGGGEGRRGGGHVHFPSFWFWYWIWSPGWGWGTPYYGDSHLRGRTRRRGERPQGPPFYKKVFAFVFGPDRPEISQERRDRDTLRFIRSRAGAVSAADLVQATGLGGEEADSELARLMAAHDGDVEVTDDGTLVYVFPSLMVSAHGTVEEREPPAAWRRLEPKLPFTGNSPGSNAAIVGINAFNLLMAASAPWFIFPRLGIGGTAAEIGLIWIPVIFSVSFFTVPLLRVPGVLRENTRRAARNVRKVLLGLVSKASLEGKDAAPVELRAAEELVSSTLKGPAHGRVNVTKTLDRLVAEFDGDVAVTPEGSTRFSFPGFRAAIAAAHRLRVKLGLAKRGVGEVVYGTADDSVTRGKRDLAAFDRELASGEAPAPDTPVAEPAQEAAERQPTRPGEPLGLPAPDRLEDYLADPDRFAFRDELELAALEEEMRREAKRRYA